MSIKNFIKSVHSITPLPVSLLSQLIHILDFSVRKPTNSFDKGILTFSIDIDIGSAALGKMDRTKKRHRRYAIGKIEEQCIPLFVDAFETYGVPVTFAIRGELCDVIGSSFIDTILDSIIPHDVGAHGYTHRSFTLLSASEAEDELYKIKIGLEKFGLKPKSFVFPRNLVSHIDLLERFEYKCYREQGGLISDSMIVEKKGELYNIHPSLYFDEYTNQLFIKKILDIAILNSSLFHLWFHLWNFGFDYKSVKMNIEKSLIPFLDYAEKKVENNELATETMLSLTKKMEKMGHLH